MSDNTKMFTEDEKIIARNIDRKYKWMARDSNVGICIYKEKPKKLNTVWMAPIEELETLVSFSHMFSSIKWQDDEPTLIKDIYDPQILDEAEREYLKTVLAPFHDEVDYLVKFGDSVIDEDDEDSDSHRKEYLYIKLYDGNFAFPDFDPGKMYAGMETDKKYTLDELGITY